VNAKKAVETMAYQHMNLINDKELDLLNEFGIASAFPSHNVPLLRRSYNDLCLYYLGLR
jgi:hypothetical protein